MTGQNGFGTVVSDSKPLMPVGEQKEIPLAGLPVMQEDTLALWRFMCLR